MNRTSFRRALVPTVAALALALTACGGNDGEGSDGEQISGNVVVDGSSTVEPMSKAASELLSEEQGKIKVAVGAAGTGGGFEKFCADKTDISDASRPIKEDEEVPVCQEAGIEYTELLVATDALTIAVHPDLDIDCLKVDQISKLFIKGSKVKNWNEIDPSFPDQEVSFFFPGTDSGTYDYMAADVFENESEELRSDVQASEDDNVLVQGVSGTEGAVGFFGFTYYEQNSDKLKALQVENPETGECVAPSVETAQDGSYSPLARPLFIYVNNKKYNDNKAVAAYVDFYIEHLEQIATAAKFIPLNEEDYGTTQAALEGIA
ncbi:PstS family phosphate ABC transporter substrate-binding protein [Nocardioides speluncae]|uniref:PstS family phosphate ABC transporter substrate-binding protein n=1 Tax=Nocardioides speluncae TaxID=2670337 RepID=UPI000D68C992|nr:PstS family phosphate ABC transporter substrate-binding protein [Nocardioides speluncae]